MSTYYYLICKKCSVHSGVSFTRQAWGWGNAYSTDTFKFLMKHAYHDIGVIDEHSVNDDYEIDGKYKSYKQDIMTEEDNDRYQPCGFIEDTRPYGDRSTDLTFIKNDGSMAIGRKEEKYNVRHDTEIHSQREDDQQGAEVDKISQRDKDGS